MTLASNNGTTRYLSTTEFANAYNRNFPLDKDYLPIEPSFVELLCEQNKIEHSVYTPGKGNKKQVFSIPEYELDKVMIMLNEDSEKKSESVEGKWIPLKEVAKLFGIKPKAAWAYVNNHKCRSKKNRTKNEPVSRR